MKSFPRHVITQAIKPAERIIKQEEEEKILTYKGNCINIVDFFSRNLSGQRGIDDIFKVVNKKLTSLLTLTKKTSF